MFESLPDEARLWIYHFSRSLSPDEYRIVTEHLDSFVANWKSHGTPVYGAYRIVHYQFILIATNDDPSGCSIDSSVKVLKQLRDKHGLNALASNLVFYRDGTEIRSIDRFQFQELVDNGFIEDDTMVFDMMITTVGALRKQEWEIPFHRSWHRKAFRKTA